MKLNEFALTSFFDIIQKEVDIMPFEFKKLAIPDVILVIPKVFNDERGFFLEAYKKSEFAKNGISLLRASLSIGSKGASKTCKMFPR